MHNNVEHVCSPRLVKAYIDRVTAPKLEAIGVSPSSATFLGKIHHNEGISLKELSDLMLVDKAHTTRTITKLIQDGLVENTAEGHQYSLRLTEKGKEVSMEAWKINEETMNNLFRDLTPEERKVMRSILEKVLNVIRTDDSLE